MILSFVTVLFLIAAGIGYQLNSRMRAMSRVEASNALFVASDRYRPMLRLLSEEDLQFVPARLRGTVRAERRMLFRRYLKCLSKDYGRLLAGVRMAMARSGADRPELAKALAKNRLLFAMAVCRIEYHLALHAAGLGRVDVSVLVEALDTLRGQAAAFMPATSASVA